MKFEFSGRRRGQVCRVAAALLIVLTGILVPLRAQDVIPPPLTPNTVTGGFNNLTGYLRAMASPDECFTAVGQNTRWAFPPCTPQQTPKANQGYIWGAALFNNILYFGTIANADCIGQGFTLLQLQQTNTQGYQTNTWTCEFSQSPYSQTNWNDPFGHALPNNLADFRPPRFYAYNLKTHTIKDITPKLGSNASSWCNNPSGGDFAGGTPLCVDALWLELEGVRSATALSSTGPDMLPHNYIVVSGPAFTASGTALNFFALDVTNVSDPMQITNSNWVAKYQTTNYLDQRRWITYKGFMYAPTAKNGNSGGAILQYTGNFQHIPSVTPGPGNHFNTIPICGTSDQTMPPPETYACFAFQEVGELPDGVATDITTHTENGDTRFFVATWPPPGFAGIYMSPPIPAGGFAKPTPSPTNWTKVWDISKNYDPDPIVSASIGTGALMEFNGQLYWGTMVYPLDGFFSWLGKYDPNHTATKAQLETAIVNTFRATTLFRGTGFISGTPTVQLLYGQAKFAVFNGPPGGSSGGWVSTNNNMTPPGTAPLYGFTGFGNLYNNYTWTMAVFNNKLYVGSMDWGYPAADAGILIFQQLWGQAKIFINALIPPSTYGADIFSFKDNNSPATAETTNGLGDYLNYGVRTMIANGTTSLLLGTANPMNLATKTQPFGGWQLIEAIPGSQSRGR